MRQGPWNGPAAYRSLFLEARIMNIDAIHTALGLTFTAIWLLVGQILVANRQTY